MSLHLVRQIVSGLRRVGLDPPQEVADALASTDALIHLHRRLAAGITPASPAAFPPKVHAARSRSIELLTSAALAGPIDPEVALIAADDIGDAAAGVARVTTALDLVDFMTGGACTNPLAHNTAAELCFAESADTIFSAMHQRVRAMVDAVPARLDVLGGSLPEGAAFATIATKPALAAFAALQADGETYRELRTMQRSLLNLVEGDAGASALWWLAEISTGLVPQQQSSAMLRGWVGDTDRVTRQDLDLPLAGEAATRRFAFHASRYGERVWVPTPSQARHAAARIAHERDGGLSDYVTGYQPTKEHAS